MMSLTPTLLAVACVAACCHTAAAAVPVPPALEAEAFDLFQVRLLDGPFKDAQQRDAAWLLEIDADRLLSGFRGEAGLTPKAPKYGGWEARGVAGHSLGHYLSAVSQMYAATGDRRFKDKADYVVGEMAACQEANGNGYVGAIPDGKTMFAQIARGDIRVNNGFDLNGGWVPWYTMHKVMAGLVDATRHAGNERAKDVLVKLADWVGNEIGGLDDKQMQEMLRVEQGGTSESLADVYALTGDAKYLKLAERFTHHAVTDPLAEGEDRLDGLHANTQVPKVIAAARLYALAGDDYYRRVADTFWTSVVRDRTFAQGGNSDHEHFFPPAKTGQNLSDNSAETCNVYNMLKLTGDLFELHPTRAAADYYERALYNQILGSQDPRRGMVTYYQPLRGGGRKTYSSPFDSWWCCTGTGMENHARYGAAVYFHKADALWVNGFLPSVLTWADKGLTLRQETDYPRGETTRLTLALERPTRLALKLRVPAWADAEPALVVNGEPQSPELRDGYATLEREWQDGDAVTWTVPMAVRAEALTGDSTKIALLYGPVTLAADLGDGGRSEASYFEGGGDENADPAAASPEVPVLVGTPADVAAGVVRVEGDRPLTFRTAGSGRPDDVTLRPFADTHFTRYSVYFDTLPDEAAWDARKAGIAAEQDRARRLALRTIDEVRPGEQQPEVDHAYRGERSQTGGLNDGKWRDARDGGFFQYDVRVDPTAANELLVMYWGSDEGNRVFDVVVDGERIATQRLTGERPNEMIQIAYPLPAGLVRGKATVTVRFQAHPDATAGGIFGLRVLRGE